MDKTGIVRIANRMAEELFGYQHGELIGQNHDLLLPEHAREKHRALRDAYMAAPKRRPMGIGMELEARRKDGSMFPVEVSLSHLTTGDVPLAVAFVSDVTLRKQQEMVLLERERELRRLNFVLLSAEEETSRRIARELHDDINQQLSFLSIEIGKAVRHLPEASPLIPQMRSYQAKIQEVTAGIRRISHEMHPAILDDLGLSAAIESLCLELEKTGHNRVHFEAQDVPDSIERTVASCLYRVSQESLRNIAKHADADQARVRLSCDGEFLTLEIIESGIGFNPEAQRRGLGMHSMEERVRLVNGTLTVTSAPSQGTRILARVPVAIR